MEWSRALVLGDSQALRAAVAPNGDVLLVAAYGGPVNLGGGPLPFDREVRGEHLLVARFGPEGTLRWVKGLVPTRAERSQVGAVAVGPDRVFVSGTYTGRFFFWLERFESGSQERHQTVSHSEFDFHTSPMLRGRRLLGSLLL